MPAGGADRAVAARGFAIRELKFGMPPRQGGGMNRRDWLGLSSAAWLGGCAPWFSTASVRAWDDDVRRRAGAMARAAGGRGWAAWEGDELVASWRTYYRGPAGEITRVLAALACARAAGEGWLRTGERVAETVSEWRDGGPREDVTVRMLLQMTAGLEPGGPEVAGEAAVARRVIREPGSRFRECPACWEVLGEVLGRKLAARGANLEEFVRRAVTEPWGLWSGDWRRDGRGRMRLSSGARLSVTELGRLGRGLAALQSGRDFGGIGSGAWRAVARPSRANPIYGGGLWRNSRAARGGEIDVLAASGTVREPSFWARAALSREQPASLVAAVASDGRRLYVWPQQARVVVRLGASPEWSDRAFLGVV